MIGQQWAARLATAAGRPAGRQPCLAFFIQASHGLLFLALPSQRAPPPPLQPSSLPCAGTPHSLFAFLQAFSSPSC